MRVRHIAGGIIGCAAFAVLGVAHAAPPDVAAPETGDPNELGAPPAAVPEPAPSPSAAASPDPSASAPPAPSAAPAVRNMDATSEQEPTPEPPPAPPPPPPPWEVRPLTVEGHLGAGTPVGLIGIMVDYLLSPAFSLAGGVGFGSAPDDSPGPHGAVMARLRPARGEKNAFILGGGFSIGPYRRLGSALGDYGTSVSSDLGYFFQGEVGWERRTPKGFMVRLTAGIAAMLNPGSLSCKDSSYSDRVTSYVGYPSTTPTPCSVWQTGEDHQEILPVIDFAIGHSF